MNSCDWFAPGSLSFELVKGLPVVFATVVIGGIAAYIAWHQWRVARAKLNLDLFDKRFAIFDATQTVLFNVVNKKTNDDMNHHLTALIPQAKFLFGTDIEKYMQEVVRMSFQISRLEAKLHARMNPTPENAQELAKQFAEDKQLKEAMELSDWFLGQTMHGCSTQFGRYLDFSQWH